MLVKLAAIFFSMILVNNYVLVKFYGICPFLGVSKIGRASCRERVSDLV